MRDNSVAFKVKKSFGVFMMLVFLAFALIPVLWVLLLSLRPAHALFHPLMSSLSTLSFSNFGSIARSEFPRAFMNSFIAASASTCLSMLVGIPAGFSLAKSRMAGKFGASWMLLMLRMAPPVGFVIPLFLIYVNIGLMDSYAGLTIAYMTLTLPLVVWSMWNSFAQIPDELIESALMDGASLGKALVLVVLPAARPGAVAAAILSFLIAWNDFFYALVITRGKTVTAPVSIMNFVSFESVDWGSIAVASICVTLPTIPLMIIANKYIVHSLSGAVKG
jgi:multiple sugar transport system permease protein